MVKEWFCNLNVWVSFPIPCGFALRETKFILVLSILQRHFALVTLVSKKTNGSRAGCSHYVPLDRSGGRRAYIFQSKCSCFSGICLNLDDIVSEGKNSIDWRQNESTLKNELVFSLLIDRWYWLSVWGFHFTNQTKFSFVDPDTSPTSYPFSSLLLVQVAIHTLSLPSLLCLCLCFLIWHRL